VGAKAQSALWRPFLPRIPRSHRSTWPGAPSAHSLTVPHGRNGNPHGTPREAGTRDDRRHSQRWLVLVIASVLRQTAPNTVQYTPSKPLTNWKSIDAECPVQHLLAQSRGRRLTSGSRFWPRALAVPRLPTRRVWGPLLRACASDPWLTLSLAVSSWNRAGPEARSPRGNRRLKEVACSSSRRRSSRLSTQAQASHPQSRTQGPQITAKSCELPRGSHTAIAEAVATSQWDTSMLAIALPVIELPESRCGMQHLTDRRRSPSPPMHHDRLPFRLLHNPTRVSSAQERQPRQLPLVSRRQAGSHQGRASRLGNRWRGGSETPKPVRRVAKSPGRDNLTLDPGPVAQSLCSHRLRRWLVPLQAAQPPTAEERQTGPAEVALAVRRHAGRNIGTGPPQGANGASGCGD